MSTVATLWVKLGLDSKGYSQGLQDAALKTQNIGKNMMAGGAAATAGLTVPLIGAGVAATKYAIDLQESQNAANVVFGESVDIMNAYGETVATTAGLSRAEFNQLGAVTGAFLKNVGFDTEQAAEETIKLTERASDMASIFNTDVSQALNAIQSGLKGEFNPLEQFGVKLNAAAINARAMQMGLADANGELSDSAKAQAALALVMEQTEQFAGDFVNTSDGLANSMKIAKAEFTDAAAALGTQLLPIGLKIVSFLSDLIEKFNALTPAQQKTMLVVLGVVAAIGPLVTIVGGLITAFGAIMPVIGAVVGVLSGPVLLVIGAIIAVIAALTWAWKNNFGGIQEKTKEFGAVLAGIWHNTLLPAFMKVWSFLKTSVFPLLSAIADFLGAVFGLAIKIVAGYIINIWLPNFMKMVDFFKQHVLPVIQKLATFLIKNLAPAFGAIAQGISVVIGWFSRMADAIRNVQLPDWLTPGSPTPFELGLLGINDALKQVTRQGLPGLEMGLQLAPAAGISAPAPVAVGGSDTQKIINIHVDSLNSRDDLDYLAQEIGRRIR